MSRGLSNSKEYLCNTSDIKEYQGDVRQIEDHISSITKTISSSPLGGR
ncbi:MAG: hypothetical protein QXK17_04510 [Metallosphaera sp.]